MASIPPLQIGPYRAVCVPDTPFGEVAVTEFVLMQSDLTPAGAIYSSLHRFGLA